MPSRDGCRVGVLVALLVVAGGTAGAGEGALWSRPPAELDPGAEYLFYLHGRIIEVEGRRPTHPEFGVYEYDAVLAAFVERGFQVISEARSPDTTMEYADRVAEQIRGLVGAGVPPGRIGVVGFSKGGILAIGVSSRLDLPELRTVVLAGCGEGVFSQPQLRLHGRVLSVFETSDAIAVSCRPLFDRSPDARETRELSISTGARHGAFYTPRAEWLDPVLAWLRGPE